MLIAGDIGGTKTNIALFKKENLNQPLHLKTFSSKDHPNLRTIIQTYLSELPSLDSPIHAGCFAVAGPVIDGVCRATNLPWIVEQKVLSEKIQAPAFLINDLEANAHSLDILEKTSLFSLYKAKERKGNRAMVSPGTGLGEAGVYWDGAEYRPFASEGGHTDFGPKTPLELRLCSYLIEKFGHASYERILSGPGIHELFLFFTESEKHTVDSSLKIQLTKEDPAKVITQHACAESDSLCVRVMELFCNILGAEGGNCILKYLAIGGLYLGGGIPPKILPLLKKKAFLEGYLDKGRFRQLLEEVPIYVITDDKASLKGAALFCLKKSK